jgi:hypothetical protein
MRAVSLRNIPNADLQRNRLLYTLAIPSVDGGANLLEDKYNFTHAILSREYFLPSVPLLINMEILFPYKPPLASYEWALEKAGVQADEAMMVAAHDSDILGVKAAGITGSFRYSPRKKHLSARDCCGQGSRNDHRARCVNSNSGVIFVV